MSKKCFIMQPFDGTRFDKLYDDVFLPALKEANIESYRVDRDPSVIIPINQIEKEIDESNICLAEITTDNPNVWFELGYAIAKYKNIILVCNEERKKYPFDIQHRTIIKYKNESLSDFTELQIKITEKALALLKKEQNLKTVLSNVVTNKNLGLAPHEVTCLANIASNITQLDGVVPNYILKEKMEKSGFNNLALIIGLKTLIEQDLIIASEEFDSYNNDSFEGYKPTDNG